jgi:hypothetical protein
MLGLLKILPRWLNLRTPPTLRVCYKVKRDGTKVETTQTLEIKHTSVAKTAAST